MVPEDWDAARSCIRGPKFISDLIGESPIFPAASTRMERAFWLGQPLCGFLFNSVQFSFIFKSNWGLDP